MEAYACFYLDMLTIFLILYACSHRLKSELVQVQKRIKINLVKTICMNMNYNYLTAIFRSILTKILCISRIIYIFFPI